MITILNLHQDKYPTSRINCYIVGRPSSLGNPYQIGRDGDRAEVIHKYRHWLPAAYKSHPIVKRIIDRMVTAYSAGKEIKLYCYCAPLPCHADVIRDFVIKLAQRKDTETK